MTNNTDTAALSLLSNEAGYDPIEAVFEEELEAFLGRCRYDRSTGKPTGYRHGHRERQLIGTFGAETVSVPRARVVDEAGKTTEWRSKALPRYQRLTKKAEALIASVYLAGTNTRRVKRALYGLFQGAVSKDVVSRAWRKVKVDWDVWVARSLADEDIVRLILDGTVIKTRIDKKATNISVLAAIGIRRDGQKVLLSIMNMGGESKAAWGEFLSDLDARDLQRPELVIVDGAPGLEAALVALWGEELPIQRCTVHKHRNLLGHAPKHMQDELTEDYRDMIYANDAVEIEKRRKALLRKWRLKCRAVASSRDIAAQCPAGQRTAWMRLGTEAAAVVFALHRTGSTRRARRIRQAPRPDRVRGRSWVILNLSRVLVKCTEITARKELSTGLLCVIYVLISVTA